MIPESVLTAVSDAIAATQASDWPSFFREICGPGGVLSRYQLTRDQLDAFRQSPEYRDFQLKLQELRSITGDSNEHEPTRVITVRLPKSLHESLKAEAHLYQTSMNQLCISKLLQFIEPVFVPGD